MYAGSSPDETYQYTWSLVTPSWTTSHTTPDIIFHTSQQGFYIATVYVTNSDGCMATATEGTTVLPPPAAPTLSIVGSPCIADAPVTLGASGYSGEMHWSNGATGATAYYFTPGLATAYYYDPALGCPSEEASIRIERQPDLDALLTGCYLKCKDHLSSNLPVYSLATDSQTIWWKWDAPSGITSGYHTGNTTPLLLPLGFGDHYLTVGSPGTSCQQTSPVLRIDEKDTCDCEDIDITYRIETDPGDCTLKYTVYVIVCNNSKESFCIGNMEVVGATGNVNVDYETLTGSSVDPGNCEEYTIGLTVYSLPPQTMMLRLYDECTNCTKEFAIGLMPEVECTETIEELDAVINMDFSNYVAAYFNISALLGSAQNVLAFWSEPSMVTNWFYSGSIVDALCMMDVALLSQLAQGDSDVCFYALICNDGELCLLSYCIKAEILYDKVVKNVNMPERMKGTHATAARESAASLVPNPTTGAVTVVAGGEVIETVVMDMYGRRLATVTGTVELDTSRLAAGSYIVRVRTVDGDGGHHVDYLKMVKK